MKIIPVLIINLRGSHIEMSELHATTILYIYMDFRNIMYLQMFTIVVYLQLYIFVISLTICRVIDIFLTYLCKYDIL
jgi:hypothetical protein